MPQFRQGRVTASPGPLALVCSSFRAVALHVDCAVTISPAPRCVLGLLTHFLSFFSLLSEASRSSHYSSLPEASTISWTIEFFRPCQYSIAAVFSLWSPTGKLHFALAEDEKRLPQLRRPQRGLLGLPSFLPSPLEEKCSVSKRKSTQKNP